MDYEALGLMVGLEIHQQLRTHKLFCSCPSELTDEVGKEFVRRLRPTQSELGEVDRAALQEARKRLTFRYQSANTCLVEADEEPPHEVNEEALRTVLTVAKMTDASVVREIHFMRKMVIDGSNTTGFQRTGLIALDGHIDVNGRRIRIPTFCLEEDSARPVEGGRKGEKVYRLDRLGIPLIEIATAPDIRSPEEAKVAAKTIGSILRATKKVKRGLGTIRQDLNISIRGGARIEIKGVQELDLIPLYVENEVKRQLRLTEVAEELKKRNAGVEREIYDLTGLFEASESKIIRNALKKGGKVLAIRLPGFAGLLGVKEGESERRLGPEFAQYAAVVGVKGIFHSDELPAYGVTEEEVENVKKALKIGEMDAFVLVAEKEGTARDALDMVLMRAEMAFKGVPEETRDAKGEGKTKYSRPLPGKARMYPETDVPPIYIDDEMMDSIEVPELREEKVERFVKQYGISRQDAEQIVDTEKDDIFEALCEYGMPKVAVRALLQILPEVGDVDEKGLRDAFKALKDGRFSKEGLEQVLSNMAKGMTIDEAIEKAGLGMMSEYEAMEIARALVSERMDFVKDRGQGAMGPLMGPFMAQVRGKLDGKKASAILRKAIEEVL